MDGRYLIRVVIIIPVIVYFFQIKIPTGGRDHLGNHIDQELKGNFNT